MKKILLILCIFIGFLASGQDDSLVVDIPAAPKKEYSADLPVTKVFYSQSLINAKTVEVLRKGVLEFRVNHNFGDIAGDNGGIEKFFGLDNASDVRIGFQLGLSDHLNLVAARAKGAGPLQQLWELGLKYQLMAQSSLKNHPLSVTTYINTVMSSMKSSNLPGQENSFDEFGDRFSELFQLMLARKFGKASLQLSPALVTRSLVVPGDDKTIFSLGGGARLPFSNKLVLVADYFHGFRSEDARSLYRSQGIDLYDVFGVGLEILTQGHVFHLNFTNATETLENRFIPRTVTSWGNGQYRWSFTISRNFTVFR